MQRYGQERTVEAHLIYAESEREIRNRCSRSGATRGGDRARMSDLIREHGLSRESIAERADPLARRRPRRGVRRRLAPRQQRLRRRRSPRWPTRASDLIVTSIPFSNHYEYTPTYNDFGHTDDNEHFWQQMDYLTPELLRVLRAGPHRRLPRQGPHPVRQRHGRRRPDRRRRSTPRRSCTAASTASTTWDDHRRHRRRPREQPDLPARLVRAVQGRRRRWASAHPSTSCCSASRRPTAAAATPTSR